MPALANPASQNTPAPTGAISYFADLYTFDWSKVDLRQPLVSALAVAFCLFTGILAGHPGGALIAGGGALTIGFGPISASPTRAFSQCSQVSSPRRPPRWPAPSPATA